MVLSFTIRATISKRTVQAINHTIPSRENSLFLELSLTCFLLRLSDSIGYRCSRGEFVTILQYVICDFSVFNLLYLNFNIIHFNEAKPDTSHGDERPSFGDKKQTFLL